MIATWPLRDIQIDLFSSSMSSPLRVRIQYKDSRNKYAVPCKFVYLINSPTTTMISQLVSLLQEFMGAHFGMENLRLAQLATEDGCLLMKHDVCADVLIKNEQLVCMDMYQFIANHLGSLNTAEAWFTLEHQDGSDDVAKKLMVGMNTRRQVYVYLFGNDDDRALFLFNAVDLLQLAFYQHNSMNLPMMKISGTTPSNWFISAEWEQESTGSNETLFLLGQLKADETSEIHKGRVRLDLNEKNITIEHWEVMQLSHPTPTNDFPTEIDPTRLTELKSTIPPLKRTGPVLDTSAITNKLQIHESHGDSAIQMMQGTGSSVEMTQEYFSRNGSFRQFDQHQPYYRFEETDHLARNPDTNTNAAHWESHFCRSDQCPVPAQRWRMARLWGSSSSPHRWWTQTSLLDLEHRTG